MNEIKDYKEVSLNVVKDASILQNEDFLSITEMKDELEDVFLHAQYFRTRTEMDVSVLNDLSFPTADAKYWQSVREQNMMFQQLVINSYEYRKLDVQVRQLERMLDIQPDDLEKELIQIEIEEKKFRKMNLEREAKDRIREIKEWHNIKEELLPQMKYSLMDVNEHQLISYTIEFINEFIQASSSGAHINSGEACSIFGKLDKAIRTCKQRKVIDKVISQFNDKQIIKLISDLGN